MPSSPDPAHGLAGRLAHRLPFFYGWVIVYIAFLGMFLMGATAFWGLPLFVGPMGEDLGWSRASIFLALTVRFIVGSFGGLLLGRLGDSRGGPALLLSVGLLIDAASMAALRWVETPLQFILLYGVVGGAGNTGMRVTIMSMIPKWFVQRRGSAVGFSSTGGGLSALIMVPVVSLMISELGWRDAWTGLALIMFLLVLPCIPFAVRAPEDIGLQPDGEGYVPKARSRAPTAATERSFTLSEAMHMPKFWLLLCGVVFGSYSLQTSTIVMVPYFEDIGFSAAVAASAISFFGVFSVAARFVWGYLGDKLSVRMAMVIQAALTSVGMVFLIYIGGQASLYVVVAYLGIMLGGFPTLAQLIQPEFFGRAHIGSIIGVTQFFSTIIGSSGPFIAGFVYDQTGSYTSAFWVLVVTWLACAIIVYSVRPHRAAVEATPARAA